MGGGGGFAANADFQAAAATQLPVTAVSKASAKVFIHTSQYKLYYIKLVP